MGKRGKTIFWYGIPAYGHVYSNLYLAGCLVKRGFRVVYYSLPEFRREIEVHGCEYRSYPISSEELVLKDGSRILRLYRLILQYTQRMLPVLTREAGEEKPDAVFFESIALWGRVVGTRMQVPSFSFYSIAAIRQIGDKAFWAYARGFFPGFLRDGRELPEILKLRQRLRKEWGGKHLGMVRVLMNQGDWNLLGYSRSFQPGGKAFGRNWLFLGPLAAHRRVKEKNDFTCPEGPVIYISLGTIFNQNQRLLGEMVRQLGEDYGKGEGGKNTVYSVVLAWDEKLSEEKMKFPGNFIVRRFVNQGEVMKRASLFITAGGMNSIHEALYYGVPCLLCPQQGEQFLNARRFEQLGFGRILKEPARLRQEIEKTIGLREQWQEPLREEMVRVRTNQLFPQALAQISDIG